MGFGPGLVGIGIGHVGCAELAGYFFIFFMHISSSASDECFDLPAFLGRGDLYVTESGASITIHQGGAVSGSDCCRVVAWRGVGVALPGFTGFVFSSLCSS